MTNILTLTMRREYTGFVVFWKCLYGNYVFDVNDFVFPLMVDAPLDSGFLMASPLCCTDCIKNNSSYVELLTI